MRVIRADALGMCFGVRDALAAMDAVASPQDATVHGELVHNEEVTHRLSARGFATQLESDRGRIPLTTHVVITAHGVSHRERARLEVAGKTLVDTTCPLVTRVHDAAQSLQRDGYFVLVVGKPGHVEVEGIVGDLDRFEVVTNASAARHYGVGKLGVVSQSTTMPDEFERVVTAIRAANPDVSVRVIDTICRPTRERQEAVGDLLDRVEALVVVGGRNSNNTRQLVRLAEERGKPAAHVQGADDLDAAWCGRYRVVGLTAGTSTLDSAVDSVERALRQLGVSA